MAYDRMDWHYGDEGFPSNLNNDAGGTHIGMFLAWAIHNDLIGDFHTQESIDSLQKVKDRKITGTEFLQKECDEKFWEEDLSDIGNVFASHYYESNVYLNDYESVLGKGLPSLYHVDDSWENFDIISKTISQKFYQWKDSYNKKWWEFWK